MRLAALAAVAAVLLAAAPAQAAGPQRCHQLRGALKLQTRTIKVVERRVNDRRLKGGRLLGCVLPRGRVFTVGERGTPKRRVGDPNSVDYSLGRFAGTFVRVERSFGDGIAQIKDIRESIMDLSDGSNRRFFAGAYGENVCQGDEGVWSRRTPPVARLVLRASGAFAVLYANHDPEYDDCFPKDGHALLAGFPARGGRVTLDLAPIAELPADSIAIQGDVVSWTSAGQPRSETLSRRAAAFPG